VIVVQGTIEKKDIGMGVWALVADNGTTYELLKCPADLRQQGLRVEVSGAIDDQAMTAAAIGPVLVVSSSQKINP
jgi:hypothetical protein